MGTVLWYWLHRFAAIFFGEVVQEFAGFLAEVRQVELTRFEIIVRPEGSGSLISFWAYTPSGTLAYEEHVAMQTWALGILEERIYEILKVQPRAPMTIRTIELSGLGQKEFLDMLTRWRR